MLQEITSKFLEGPCYGVSRFLFILYILWLNYYTPNQVISKLTFQFCFETECKSVFDTVCNDIFFD